MSALKKRHKQYIIVEVLRRITYYIFFQLITYYYTTSWYTYYFLKTCFKTNMSLFVKPQNFTLNCKLVNSIS